jgi:hypothetical protein
MGEIFGIISALNENDRSRGTIRGEIKFMFEIRTSHIHPSLSSSFLGLGVANTDAQVRKWTLSVARATTTNPFSYENTSQGSPWAGRRRHGPTTINLLASLAKAYFKIDIVMCDTGLQPCGASCLTLFRSFISTVALRYVEINTKMSPGHTERLD